MEKFLEIGEYIRAIGRADVSVPGNARLSFNNFGKTIEYLQDLLQPEIYLYRVIREVMGNPDLFSYEEQLMNCLEQARSFFFTHPDTLLLMHSNLKVESRGKVVEYADLPREMQMQIAEFVTEQYCSYMRVRGRVDSFRQQRKE